MKVIVDTQASFESFEKNIKALASQGFMQIMVFHGEGGIDTASSLKEDCDKLLGQAFRDQIRIFGGIFPGLVDDGKLLKKGIILVGIHSDVHIVTLPDLSRETILDTLKQGIVEIESKLAGNGFQTLFVFADGFGESNLNLINALNWLVKKYPINILGGMAGRERIKSSYFNILTPKKIIQNGAVLAFARLKSGIGVKHGWDPLPGSKCRVTGINGCFIEEINGMPALDFYIDFISGKDPAIARKKQRLLKDVDLFFEEVAIKYPLGIIRKQKDKQQIIDRTPISVGADKSLQFSVEIPVGTDACILYLKGASPEKQCSQIKAASRSAYIESLKNFPAGGLDHRVIVMDCFGRKKMVEKLGQEYGAIEFEVIAADEKDKEHSPIGPLTFGEISSMAGGYVELHNKTAVVGTVEDA